MKTIDYIVLFTYFILITAFGIWMSRRIRSSDSYFRGGRKFRWWVMIGQAFGVGTHAEMPVAQTGATFNSGFATIWYQWKNMLITPFYWLLAPFYRRSERTTVGEIIEDRYGRSLGLVYSIFAITFFVFSMGVMLQGAAKVISVASGQLVSPNMVVFIMTVTFLLYSFIGGLIASAYRWF
jgi:Na+/proline symporter